ELRRDDERPVGPGGQLSKVTLLVSRVRTTAGERQQRVILGEHRLDGPAVQRGEVSQNRREHGPALGPQGVRGPLRPRLTTGILVDEDLHAAPFRLTLGGNRSLERATWQGETLHSGFS